LLVYFHLYLLVVMFFCDYWCTLSFMLIGKYMIHIRIQPPTNWICICYEFEGNMSKPLSSLRHHFNGCNESWYS
jgi:hypothetical protein